MGDNMNHKQLLALFLSLVIILSPTIISIENEKVVDVKAVNNNIDEITIESIIEKNDDVDINIYYPVTKNSKVNNMIKDKIDSYITKLKETNSFDSTKKLNISFETFKSGEYISLKFNVSSSAGITHKTEEVFTFVYANDEIIDIDTLAKSNPKLIENLYSICKEELLKNEKFKKYSNIEWLNRGLLKNKNTFSKFIFDGDNMIVIFNPYEVAPYVAGIFEIKISCNLI